MDSSEIIATLESAYFGAHPAEEEVLSCLPKLLKKARHFVDVGASLGQYTLRANGILKGATIDAIEADPVRFQKLRENCEKWAASGQNKITAHHLAIAAHSGQITFFSTQSNVSGGLFKHSLDHLDDQNRARVHWEGVPVTAATLDELYRETTPDLVKMDIEGAEWDALTGGQQLLHRRKTMWLIELHDFGGAKPAQVIELMRANGYAANALAPGRVLFRPLTMRIRVAQLLRSFARRLKRLARK